MYKKCPPSFQQKKRKKTKSNNNNNIAKYRNIKGNNQKTQTI